MGRTWQIFWRICLPCGRNQSSGRIAKCDPKFSSWKKLWKSQNTSKTPNCLGRASLPGSRFLDVTQRFPKTAARETWVGQTDFGKLELNNRNHSGNFQRLSGKRDQFETDQFEDLWNNRRNFLTFALSSWKNEAATTSGHFNVFTKTLFKRAIHKLIILRHFNVFTGTLYRRANKVQSEACHSPC